MKSHQPAKLRIIFFGAKVASWVNGASVPIARTLDTLKQNGSRIITIGDKESTDTESLGTWNTLKSQLEHFDELGFANDEWIVVIGNQKRINQLVNVIGHDAVPFLYAKLPPGRYTYLYDNPHRSDTDKINQLYHAIQRTISTLKTNNQKQDTIMNQPDPRTSPSITRDMTDFTTPEAMDILAGALQFITVEANESFDKEKLIVHLKLYHEQLAREVAAARQKPASNKQRELTDIALALAAIATHFEHRCESLTTNDNRMVESLRKIETRTSALALKGAEDMSFNSEMLIQRLVGEFAKGHKQMEQSILKLAKDFTDANNALAQAMASLTAIAHERHQQTIHSVSNIERSLSIKVEDHMQHLLGMLLRQPTPSQPFGPLNPMPMNSFPQMPDGFGNMRDYGYNPLGQRGAIPPRNPFPRGGFGATFPDVVRPESFDGIFVIHVENNDANAVIETSRRGIMTAYPNAKIVVVNYEEAKIAEALFEKYKQISDEMASRYRNTNSLQVQIVVKPAIRIADLEKVTTICNMLQERSIPYTGVPSTAFNDRVALTSALNGAIKAVWERSRGNSFGQYARERSIVDPSNYSGVVVFHADGRETDQVLGASGDIVKEIFPHAQFYTVVYPDFRDESLSVNVPNAVAFVEGLYKTKQLFHVVISNEANEEYQHFASDVFSILSQSSQPAMILRLTGNTVDKETFHKLAAYTMRNCIAAPNSKEQLRF